MAASVAGAEARLGRLSGPPPARRQRRDRGMSRLRPALAARLHAHIDGYERPRIQEVLSDIRRTCRKRGWRVPSRATVYNFMARAPLPRYRVASLPPHVQDTLFNLEPESEIPGDQLVFHCMNYGGTEAISFAAGLPWRHLYCALLKRGWRPRSRGMLEAIVQTRLR